MSAHASAASADLAAQNYLDSDNKRTLLHDAKPDHAEIHSESYEESVAEIHSESKRKPDAEIHSEIKRKPDAEIQSEWDEENKNMRVAEIHSESERKPVAEIHYERDDTVEPEYSDSDIVQEIQLQNWIKGVMDKIKEDADDRRRSSSDVSIVTVPKSLKDTKREAYVPQTVSLGPHHHGSEDLRPMDRHKARALRRMMTRFNTNMNLDSDSDNDQVFVQHAMRAILKLEDEIRNSYERKISCKQEELAWMLCLDGCFILEVLKTLGRDPEESYIPIERNEPYERNDPIFGGNELGASNIVKDMLMIENQIPLIVLLELQRLEHPMDDDVQEMLLTLLVKGVWGLFKISGKERSAQMERNWLYPVQEVHHVLGFLHKVIVDQPSCYAKRVDEGEYSISIERCICHCLVMLQDKSIALNPDFESIPHAVELKDAGFKFLRCNGGISGIMFDRRSATIYLPLVSITDLTEVLLRNLIVFEMRRPSEIKYVTSYIKLMTDLIVSEEDVALLRRMGIFTCLIGNDKEVADLFKGLCKDVGTVSMENVFDELRKEVMAKFADNKYKIRVRANFAELERDHFSSPWKALALAGAIAILCLTLIQTIFTIISVYK